MSIQEGSPLIPPHHEQKLNRAWRCFWCAVSTVCIVLLGVGGCLGLVLYFELRYTVPPAYGPPIIATPQPRLPDYGPWCVFEFNESHVGWSANQPPQEWTRIFLPACNSMQGVQITPYDSSGNVTRAGTQMHIFEAYASFGVLYVGLEYWGEPWKLYIGGKMPPSFFANPWQDVNDCGAAIYKGVPPTKRAL